jgi:hypothetical protein
MSDAPLISPRGSRTGDVLGLDVGLQVRLAPVLAAVRDQCLRRGPAGFLHLADASGLRSASFGAAVFMEPDRYRNLLIDNGMRISKEDSDALNGAFCDPRGYFRVALFLERVIAIFAGERRTRTETFFTAVLGAATEGGLRRAGAAAAGAAVVAATRSAAPQSSWDDAIPVERREWTPMTFAALMAGVSVVTAADDEFNAVLRSFQPAVAVAAAAAHAARAAEFFDGQTAKAQHKCTSPRREVLAAQERARAATELPRYIAGFMGHIACIGEDFGRTHYDSVRAAPRLPEINRAKHADDPVAEPAMMPVRFRGGNKSNFHNFSLS